MGHERVLRVCRPPSSPAASSDWPWPGVVVFLLLLVRHPLRHPGADAPEPVAVGLSPAPALRPRPGVVPGRAPLLPRSAPPLRVLGVRLLADVEVEEGARFAQQGAGEGLLRVVGQGEVLQSAARAGPLLRGLRVPGEGGTRGTRGSGEGRTSGERLYALLRLWFLIRLVVASLKEGEHNKKSPVFFHS